MEEIFRQRTSTSSRCRFDLAFCRTRIGWPSEPYTTDQKTRRDFTSFTFLLSFLPSLSSLVLRVLDDHRLNNFVVAGVITLITSQPNNWIERRKEKKKKRKQNLESPLVSLSRDCSAFPFTRHARTARLQANIVYIYITVETIFSTIRSRFERADSIFRKKTRRRGLRAWNSYGWLLAPGFPLGRRPCENASFARKREKKEKEIRSGLSWTNTRASAASTHWNLPGTAATTHWNHRAPRFHASKSPSAAKRGQRITMFIGCFGNSDVSIAYTSKQINGKAAVSWIYKYSICSNEFYDRHFEDVYSKCKWR